MNMKTLKQNLTEAACPGCGDPKAYIGLNKIECPNRVCKHYVSDEAEQCQSCGDERVFVNSNGTTYCSNEDCGAYDSTMHEDVWETVIVYDGGRDDDVEDEIESINGISHFSDSDFTTDERTNGWESMTYDAAKKLADLLKAVQSKFPDRNFRIIVRPSA